VNYKLFNSSTNRVQTSQGESRWLPKINRKFLVQRYIYDKIFTKIWSVFPQPCCRKKIYFASLKNPF